MSLLAASFVFLTRLYGHLPSPAHHMCHKGCAIRTGFRGKARHAKAKAYFAAIASKFDHSGQLYLRAKLFYEYVMELAILANFFLFLGTFAVKLSSIDTDDPVAQEDQLYNKADYVGVQNGGSGDDIITANRDNSAFFLGEGNDKLTASAGKDYANLGGGNDQADMGAGDDIALGGAGMDRIFGDTGNDALFGGLGNDSLSGGLGGDSLAGGDGEDSIWGGTGSDTLIGGAGNDTISGFDQIKGGANGMAAGDGIDILNGGDGNDRLLMGRGDIGIGGAGNDVFEMDTRWTDGAGQFVVEDFQRGQDRLELTYTPIYDPVTGVETLPTLAVSLAPGGESSLITLNGVTIATINGVKDLALSDLQLVRAVINDSTYDPTNYATQSFGTDADGTVTATGSTAHFAQGGNDQFTGSSARDYADIGLGNDRADMGAGDDSALGGEGADTISGGDGNDALRGGSGADKLGGDAGNDSLDGGADNDQLSGGFGADTIYGGFGNDTISGFDAGSSNPESAGANEGSDLIYGGAGSDRIWAGTGDRVYGGADNDVFVLDENRYDASAIPRLEDFATGDKIEIHYDTGTASPEITLSPSGVAGETNVLADGQIVAKVVHGLVPLTLTSITTVAS